MGGSKIRTSAVAMSVGSRTSVAVTEKVPLMREHGGNTSAGKRVHSLSADPFGLRDPPHLVGLSVAAPSAAPAFRYDAIGSRRAVHAQQHQGGSGGHRP